MLKSNIAHVSMADLNGQASQTPQVQLWCPNFSKVANFGIRSLDASHSD